MAITDVFNDKQVTVLVDTFNHELLNPIQPNNLSITKVQFNEVSKSFKMIYYNRIINSN